MVTKRKFWSEMNRHKNTKYRCVNGKYIIEYGDGPLTETNNISVWRHQKDGGADHDKGEVSYPHAWVKVASAQGDPDEMDDIWSDLTTEKAILELRDSEDNDNRTLNEQDWS